MNLETILHAVSSKTARQTLQLQKHSPKILFIAGTVGVIGTVVLACRATLKVGDVLDQHETLTLMTKCHGDDEETIAKNSRKLQVKTAVEIVKPYLLPLGLGIVSIGALTGSHVILTKRNGAAMATIAALDKAYNQYRQRVVREYGEDADRKFVRGDGVAYVEEKMADGITKITPTKTRGEGGGSPYAALFDEKSKHFTKMPGMNSNTLMMIQNHATDKLRARGHLFLNEVLDMLDLPRSSAGQIVGWIYNSDPNNIDHAGDNYVTFGVWDNDDEYVESFMDGHENAIWLDFNVDGPVFELI